MSTKKPVAAAATPTRPRRSGPVPRSTTTAPAAGVQARQRVGVIGLGIMGSAMANNLRRDGFEVWGYDPSPAARKALKAMGGTVCKSAADVAGRVDAVITSLPSAAALLDTARDLAEGAARGLIVIETSTLDIEDKRQARDALQKTGVVLLDCPLSGTGAQAALKDLTIYASGPAAAIRKVEPVFKGFTSAQFNLGVFGNGMKMKLMANLLVAIHNVSTAEALLLGQRWGIAPSTAVKVLAGGAGGSRMLQVRGPQMENEGWKTVTMKIAVWQKDMKLIAAALKDAGVPAPLFAATVPLYDAAMGMGHGLHDTAAVFDVLDRMSKPAA